MSSSIARFIGMAARVPGLSSRGLTRRYQVCVNASDDLTSQLAEHGDPVSTCPTTVAPSRLNRQLSRALTRWCARNMLQGAWMTGVAPVVRNAR